MYPTLYVSADRLRYGRTAFCIHPKIWMRLMRLGVRLGDIIRLASKEEKLWGYVRIVDTGSMSLVAVTEGIAESCGYESRSDLIATLMKLYNMKPDDPVMVVYFEPVVVLASERGWKHA